jgi:hypothetical protein
MWFFGGNEPFEIQTIRVTTGNETAAGKYRYLCAAMIVFKKK